MRNLDDRNPRYRRYEDDDRNMRAGDYGRSDYGRDDSRGDRYRDDSSFQRQYDRDDDFADDRRRDISEDARYGSLDYLDIPGAGQMRRRDAQGEWRSGYSDQKSDDGYSRRNHSASRSGSYGRSMRGAEDMPQMGMNDEGEHRGKGPKGYSRSDDRLREDVCDRLMDDGHVDASEIEVSVKKGEVTLQGTVDTRAAKRRAEDCVEDCAGVKHVQNNLRVSDTSKSDDTKDSPAQASRA